MLEWVHLKNNARLWIFTREYIDEVGSEENKIILAIDSVKEAQVLVREISLSKEAEATAKLAYIFRAVPAVHDKAKSEIYYQHSFSLINSNVNRYLRLT